MSSYVQTNGGASNAGASQSGQGGNGGAVISYSALSTDLKITGPSGSTIPTAVNNGTTKTYTFSPAYPGLWTLSFV